MTRFLIYYDFIWCALLSFGLVSILDRNGFKDTVAKHSIIITHTDTHTQTHTHARARALTEIFWAMSL